MMIVPKEMDVMMIHLVRSGIAVDTTKYPTHSRTVENFQFNTMNYQGFLKVRIVLANAHEGGGEKKRKPGSIRTKIEQKQGFCSIFVRTIRGK